MLDVMSGTSPRQSETSKNVTLKPTADGYAWHACETPAPKVTFTTEMVEISSKAEMTPASSVSYSMLSVSAPSKVSVKVPALASHATSCKDYSSLGYASDVRRMEIHFFTRPRGTCADCRVWQCHISTWWRCHV